MTLVTPTLNRTLGMRDILSNHPEATASLVRKTLQDDQPGCFSKTYWEKFLSVPKAFISRLFLGPSLFSSMYTVNFEIDCVSVFALAIGKLQIKFMTHFFHLYRLYQICFCV